MPDYSFGKIYTIRCRYDDNLIYVGSTVEKKLCDRMSKHRSNSKQDRCINIPLYQEVNKTNWDDWFMELYEDCPCESKEQLNKREGQIIREIGTLNKQVAGRSRKEYRIDNSDKLKQYHKQYRQENAAKLNEYKCENAERIKERRKEYCQENAERIKEISKEYYHDNFEKINEKNKQYNRENAEKLKEYRRQYYQDNADKIQEYNKEYRRNNSEKIKEISKEYLRNNSEKIKEYRRNNAEKQKEYRRENAAKLHEYTSELITCQCGSVIARGGFARHKRTNKHIENMKKMIDT
jgi:hypothetical protein